MPVDLTGVKWDDAPSGDAFERALRAEGVTGRAADFVRAIYQQESGGGRNTRTSNAGAVGGMQIIPATFAEVADKGWNITDPEQNARAGIRYALRGLEAARGDPALAGAFYYGGPGGLAKAQQGRAVSDPRNPGAPDTLQYGRQVAARMPSRQPGLVQRAVESIIPSAEAAQAKIDLSGVKWDDAPAEAAPADVPRVEVRGTSADEPSLLARAGRAVAGTAGDIGAGALAGAANIGATLLTPIDAAARAVGVQNDFIGRTDRRQATEGALRSMGADPSSIAYGAGKLGAEVAGTAGVGGVLAAPLRAAGVAAPLAEALTTGGMRVAAPGVAPAGGFLANTLLRIGAGAATGGASAGLIDPSSAGTGVLIGGAIPGAAAVAGRAGQAVGRALTGGGAAPEVRQLAQRAEQLGIDIPADRIANSKPLNAVAAGLNYVPFSGRAGTEARMQSQLNQALSRTFGQNSDNVTAALRKAQTDLGSKFDTVLKSNTVQFDQQLLADLGDVSQRAVKELPPDLARIINNQIDDITQAAGANGQIDGQLAYNIKRTLDKISNRNSSEAFYARDLKGRLMSALDRSLGPKEAAAFAKVRQQYGNMLELENLAQNGAEGNISIARIANLKGLNNPDLQELADISAQFLKPREGQHGAAQRAFAGIAGLGMGGLPAVASGAAIGRGTNALLNSSMARNAALGMPGNAMLAAPQGNALLQLGYRTAPLLGVSQ